MPRIFAIVNPLRLQHERCPSKVTKWKHQGYRQDPTTPQLLLRATFFKRYPLIPMQKHDLDHLVDQMCSPRGVYMPCQIPLSRQDIHSEGAILKNL